MNIFQELQIILSAIELFPKEKIAINERGNEVILKPKKDTLEWMRLTRLQNDMVKKRLDSLFGKEKRLYYNIGNNNTFVENYNIIKNIIKNYEKKRKNNLIRQFGKDSDQVNKFSEFELNSEENYINGIVTNSKNQTKKIRAFLSNDNTDVIKIFEKRPTIDAFRIMDNTLGKNYKICISRLPWDIVSVSSGQRWKSCMTLPGYHPDTPPTGGMYHQSIKGDLEGGTIVAYLIEEGGEDLKNPKPHARLSAKPFILTDTNDTNDIDDITDIIYVNEERLYTTNSCPRLIIEEFNIYFNKWLSKQEDLALSGIYKRQTYTNNHQLYNDGDTQKKEIINPNDIERYYFNIVDGLFQANKGAAENYCIKIIKKQYFNNNKIKSLIDDFIKNSNNIEFLIKIYFYEQNIVFNRINELTNNYTDNEIVNFFDLLNKNSSIKDMHDLLYKIMINNKNFRNYFDRISLADYEKLLDELKLKKHNKVYYPSLEELCKKIKNYIDIKYYLKILNKREITKIPKNVTDLTLFDKYLEKELAPSDFFNILNVEIMYNFLNNYTYEDENAKDKINKYFNLYYNSCENIIQYISYSKKQGVKAKINILNYKNVQNILKYNSNINLNDFFELFSMAEINKDLFYDLLNIHKDNIINDLKKWLSNFKYDIINGKILTEKVENRYLNELYDKGYAYTDGKTIFKDNVVLNEEKLYILSLMIEKDNDIKECIENSKFLEHLDMIEDDFIYNITDYSGKKDDFHTIPVLMRTPIENIYEKFASSEITDDNFIYAFDYIIKHINSLNNYKIIIVDYKKRLQKIIPIYQKFLEAEKILEQFLTNLKLY